MSSIKIGISLGDPGGIGPEVTLKALFSVSKLPKAEYILFGSRKIIEKETNILGHNINIPDYNPQKKDSPTQLAICSIPYPLNSVKYGYACKENGKISFEYFKKAVNEAKKGSLHAVVTAPISKQSWKLAGINWAGHTEYLRKDYPEAIMSFFSRHLNVALFTHHISLKKALVQIKKKNLCDFFVRLNKFSQEARNKKFHLLVPGLNPHAGENGLLGNEEITEIHPAINAARKKGVSISGPYPPDTVFKKAYKDKNKIVASLYHDQGLIAFKIVSFEDGVNTTLGLPFIRTSPDHGTAFDIVGKGTADPQSMIEAIKLAVQFSQNQRS